MPSCSRTLGATRTEHEFIHRHMTINCVTISPDGCRLLRARRPDNPLPLGGPTPAAEAATREGRLTIRQALDNLFRGRAAPGGKVPFLTVHGLSVPAYVIAHILRVGPDGPLIGPGPWEPIDGDWLNVHPDNWPPTALF